MFTRSSESRIDAGKHVGHVAEGTAHWPVELVDVLHGRVAREVAMDREIIARAGMKKL
jgi:hypothetical protein